MSLNLDARQRAMLQEMGVRVWQAPEQVHAPQDEIQAAPVPTLAQVQAPTSAAHGSLLTAVQDKPLSTPADQQPDQFKAPVISMSSTPADTSDWQGLLTAVSQCQACALSGSRQQAVFGAGAEQARWLVVSEAPTEAEDAQGLPLVGAAGPLFDNMLRAVGLSRNSPQIFITNAVKCRPPANRNPQPDELAHCAQHLRRQIAHIQPALILALGRFAAQTLLQDTLPEVATLPLGKLRGQLHSYQHPGLAPVPVVVTHHPSYLLRAQADKAKVWADLCLALATAPLQADTPVQTAPSNTNLSAP